MARTRNAVATREAPPARRSRKGPVTKTPEGISPSTQPELWTGPDRHLLDLDHVSTQEITEILRSTDGMKEVLSRRVRKTPALRGKTIVTLFFEASTRTRVSFEQAGKVLGADVINVTASASSVTKGESLLNTVRTLESMHVDVLVIRHPHSGAPYFVASHVDAPVVNAGDGTHAHPTQALLDLYTIESHLGGVAGKKIAIIGDLLYSRVARSNLWGLTKMGANVVVYGPPTLMPPELDNAEGLDGVVRAASMEEAVDEADVVMMLRIQRERQAAGHLPSMREYSRVYGLNARRLKLARPGALVMHPGPMNEGIEISPDVAHGAQAVIEEQVANGVAVRMAVLYMLAARGASGR